MANEAMEFDPSMKKKKTSSARKKSVAFDDADTAQVADDTAQPTGEAEDLFTGKKTKAKKILKDTSAFDDDDDEASASASAGAGDAAEAAAEDGDADLDFSSLKKKKKKRVIDTEVAELEAKLEEAGIVDDGDQELDGDDPFGKADGDESRTEDDDGKAQEEAWLKSDRDYTYEELLHRIFRILRENNPSLGLGKKVTLPPPLVFREGSKKTIFANIYDMSVRLHRPLDHFKDYLFAELGTNGSVDGSNRLTLKGRFQQKQLENVVRRYIHEYVTCKTCKSPDTLLAKENRVWFITCESCGSKRSVSAIKTGFQAQTSRRRLKAAG